MHVDGSCHCGAITYEAEIDPSEVEICHCTDCQTLASSPFAAMVPVPKAALALKGEPKIYVKTAESGARRALAFCPECGTRIYGAAEKDPQVYSLRVGTIRQRAALTPRMQIWCRSALPWLGKVASAPGYPKQPPG